jgi:hypothetical protein
VEIALLPSVRGEGREKYIPFYVTVTKTARVLKWGWCDGCVSLLLPGFRSCCEHRGGGGPALLQLTGVTQCGQLVAGITGTSYLGSFNYSKARLNGSSERLYPYLVPDLRRKLRGFFH